MNAREVTIILTEIAQRKCGQVATDVLRAPFVLGDKDRLIELLQAAGISPIAVELRNGTITFPSVETFVETEVKGWPLERLLDEESYRALVTEATDKLQSFLGGTW